MGGVLPFGCIFIQLFFVLNSIWSSQIYYMYGRGDIDPEDYGHGFLFLVFVILIITCSETTILLCYFHLCAEVRPCLTSLPENQTNQDIIFSRIITGGGAAS